ncbi:septum formation family protein [uncultured Microbacterium sp.]|uniref:septum formation family protein n=1 Tax=uncultured Microbacterium sp. TaxID=191216 RepID=UPI002615CD28|nr:septum formation family protein [uncultured Microbacterium sp.]
MNNSRIRRALATAGTASLLVASLTGCGMLDSIAGADTQRDDAGNVTESSEIDIFALQVGDCLSESGMTGDETASAPVVPCSEPHPYEVYHEFELADGEFPGTEAIEPLGVDGCQTAFDGFVGLAWEESTLDYTWFEPTEQSWNGSDDRLIQCIIVEVDATGSSLVDVVGSLAGVAR